MQLQATAQVYLNIQVTEDGSIVVTHAFPNDPNPCEVRIYDSEDTPYEGCECWDIFDAVVAWVDGLDEAAKGLGLSGGPSSPDPEPTP
jgi:hypothetical protein